VEVLVGCEDLVNTTIREKWRVPPMTIAKVLAVYKTSPIVLVVESAEGTVLELSLTDMHGAGHRFSDGAWTSLIDEYQMFTCPSAAG
jgi:hypothetical protein